MNYHSAMEKNGTETRYRNMGEFQPTRWQKDVDSQARCVTLLSYEA